MDGDMRMKDMAFLYESADQGKAGSQGTVEVLDLRSIEVLSIGMRGKRSNSRIELAKALITGRMAEMGMEPAGDWRVLGYNSPMVSVAKRYWELQVPIRKK